MRCNPGVLFNSYFKYAFMTNGIKGAAFQAATPEGIGKAHQ